MLSSSTTALNSRPQAVTESMIFCGALAAKPLDECISTCEFPVYERSVPPRCAGALSWAAGARLFPNGGWVGILDYVVLVRDDTTSLSDFVHRAVDYVHRYVARVCDDDGLLDVHGDCALGDSESRDDGGEETHRGWLWKGCM